MKALTVLVTDISMQCSGYPSDKVDGSTGYINYVSQEVEVKSSRWFCSPHLYRPYAVLFSVFRGLWLWVDI